jgi:hypothetical protein
MNSSRVGIRQLMGGQDVLFGVPMGRQCFAKLLDHTTEPLQPSIVLLDFEGVGSATVSFLREGPLAYRQHLRGQFSTLYPVFANLAAPVADSLAEYLTTSRDAVFACDHSPQAHMTNPRLLGQLEPKQKLTFEAVVSAEGATAAELARAAGDDDGVLVTAWNNRLAALVQKGLLVETRTGRKKTFRSIFTREAI